MALIGNTNEEKIWNYFIQKDKIGNGYGVAGLMGNIKKESNFNPKNMQNSYEAKLGFTDETYVEAVDNNTYHGFQTDRCGFGLCQHTSSGRKTNMWIRSKETNKSIGDLEFQLDFIMWEFNNGYKTVLNMLKNATSVKEASDIVCTKYERPADQSEKALKRRSDASEEIYEKFIGKEKDKENKVGDKMGYTNSPLVNYKKISPNKTTNRNHVIDVITIHCVVGQVTVERLGEIFANPSRKASSNYGIGKDGKIGLYVEEKDRSWCTGGELTNNGRTGKENDYRAVTIEVASDTFHPYAITNEALQATIRLCADICKRNNIKKLVWSTNKNDRINHLNGCNMTVHRDYAKKSCPGDYIYGKMQYIADEVNKILGTYVSNSSLPSTPSTATSSTYTKTQFIKDIQSAIGAKVDGIAGKETLSKTVTVSKTKNNRHAVVKPIQRYLNVLGFSCGAADGIAGVKFDSAIKAYQKANGCVADGEITARKNTWKHLLGML